MRRDFEGKSRGFRERPVWKGPIPDRYYYAVKNNKHPKMSAYVVLYSDDPRFERYIRQIACNQSGNWSLIESDVPLPEDAKCVKRSHGKVDEIKEKLFRSHPQMSELVLDINGMGTEIPAIPVSEEEMFG